MGGVFGKSKKQASRVTEQDKAVLVSFTSFLMSFLLPENLMIFDFPANETTKR